jgi:ABC-type sugar transport system substrate-binding protein
MKKRTKKSLAAFFLVMLVGNCLLISCNSRKKETKSEGEFLVGFANNNDIWDYCAKFRAMLKEETEALGMRMVATNAGGDTNVQNGHIDDFIAQDAKVVSAISNDFTGSAPAVEAARKAGIPYVSFLASVGIGPTYDKFIYVGSQNYDAGIMQGTFATQKFPQNAQVIYFTGQPSDQQYVDRRKGFFDGINSRSDIKVLAEFNVDNRKDLGISTTEDCLQSFSHFDAIVCQNDDSALGVVEALKSARRLGSVIVVGLDGSDGALDAIKAGELDMSVLQDARAQAKAGAQVFKKIKDGIPANEIEDVFVPFKIITKDNVDEFLK